MSHRFAISSVALLLAACGGGGGSSTPPPNSGNPPAPVPAPPPPPPPPAPVIPEYGGSFEAFWIQGLGSETSTGLKYRVEINHDYRNTYSYHEGDSIVFNFGDLKLPRVPAVSQTSLFEIFRTRNHNANEIRNFTRLVLTVANKTPDPEWWRFATGPEYVPEIPEAFASPTRNVYVTLADLSLSPSAFEGSPNVAQFLASAGKAQLASADVAFDYWIEAIGRSVINLDGDSWTNAEDIDDDGDGVEDENDAFPWDADEYVDANGDGVGDDGTTRYFRLAFAPYAGDGGSLPICLHDIAYLEDSGRLFITNQVDKSLSIFDIETGTVVKKITFDYKTTKIALDEARGKLFVLLAPRGPNNYDPLVDKYGYVAVIDTTSLEQVNLFEIGIDPFDVVLTTDGDPVISSGTASEQSAELHLYKADTGALLSSARIAPNAYLAYEPVKRWLYAKPLPSSIHKFEIVGNQLTDTGIRNNRPVSPGTSTGIEPAGDLWITPDGQRLITSNGTYYSTETLEYQSFFPGWLFGVEFDPVDNHLLTMSFSTILQRYELPDFDATTVLTYNRPLFGRTLIWGQKLNAVYTRGLYVYLIQTEGDGQLTMVRKPKL